MKKLHITACALLSLASMSAMAQENTFRVGLINLNVHSQSPDFVSNGPAFLTPQPAGLTVGNATTLLLAYTRKLNDHFDLDIVMGLPPKHDVYGRGMLAPFGVTAQVKQRAPTVFVNYNFFEPTAKFRPFVGLGLNYTEFFDANSTASGNIATGGPTKIDLTESWGAAAQIGASYKLADRWSLCGSIATADVRSNMTATTGSIQRSTRINFRPVVFTLGVGYSF
jgi:outer membrane protein